MAPPTAFVSYSWDSEEHCAWVMKLASDLRSQGVDVILDRWDLPVSGDVTAFMDRIASCDYAILVCTERYASKADARSGGVAWEYTVLTGDMFWGEESRIDVVPVMRSGAPSSALPRYLKTRLFIDFRDDASYAASLERLLRHIHGVPLHPRPELGPAPSFAESAAALPAGPVTPHGWILVAGIGRASAFTEQQRSTAEAIGRVIARLGFGLVTGGWPGVDEVVARSFADELSHRARPLEDFLVQVVHTNSLPSFPAGDLVLARRRSEEWTLAIDRAQVVVLIGGAGGTWTTGTMALRERRIVLPLADTGGDAKKLYMHMLSNWDELGIDFMSRREFQALGRSAPGVATQVEAVLQTLIGRMAAGRS